ncbi:thioredoxin family protein [Vibrio sp. D420a]|uniref:thioredoxin family protein n=1 Tax=Vibrio sp. D420a TaxID=2836895 RepID=UPI00255539AA|nr:thioredoxin family protein [Vibrio sp. D420a]MDK9762079.1 thioredoxin family protein [Vibrio sp. D420a]
MKTYKKIFCLLLAAFSCNAFSFSEQPYNQGYSPERDPFSDFELAVKDAQKNNTTVLLILGGDWCVWCHKLSSFMKKEDSVRERWDETFTTMKVNVSEENYNDEFLSYLPEPQGYPFFVMINVEREIVGKKDTGGLESMWGGYSVSEFNQFIERWSDYNNSVLE